MNSKLQKTNVKGKDAVSLSIEPVGNLESAFFDELFGKDANVEFITNPGNYEITIQRKAAVSTEPPSLEETKIEEVVTK